MIDKSFISVADHQYDEPLSYESSRSSEFYSDEPDDEHRIKPLPNSIHVERERRKNEQIEDYMSDSKNSDDQFLECESDFESPNRYNNPFVDYDTLVDIYREKKNLERNRNSINGKNDPKGSKSDYTKAEEEISSESQRSGTTKSFFLGSKFRIGNVHRKSESNSKEDQKVKSPSKSKRGEKEVPGVGEEKVDRNSSFTDQMLDVVASEMGSDVNSDIESRIVDYHESKKNVPKYECEEGEEEGMGSQAGESEVYRPEDEVDQLFDRVINGGNDPDFTFMPEALDPYVKMSKKLISRKRKGNQDGNGKKDIADTVINTAMTILGTKENENTTLIGEEAEGACVAEGKSVSEGTQVDPSLVEPTLVETIPPSDTAIEKRIKLEEGREIMDSAHTTPKIDKCGKTKEFEEQFAKTDSDVEKERERARMLFEATKYDETLYRRNTEELSTGLKVLKLREDKKSKKSKHRKSDTRAETETEDERPKKDKKGEEKGSKSTTLKSDKTEEKSEKGEKGDKSDKSSKERKSDKSKKSSWKSNDYDIIFSSLGDSFSSGLIEVDSKPILLSRKGFYTIFMRNSKYPYDSTIDFYLFRVGVKYMLVNEASSQSFNIDDVVDYGNFRIKLSGNINLSPNVTKMALIYSNSERQTLEFSLTPSAFALIDFSDSKPKIMYKMFYSGPLQSIPMPLKFRRSLFLATTLLRNVLFDCILLRVLSLDNSENLGTSVIGALYLLEKKLSEMKKKKVNLTDYFDYICGTGAGALIALCMLKGYSMKDLRSQWNIVVSSLFKWTYSLPSGIIFDYYYIEEFKKNFINILGTDFLCSKPWPHCMVTCTNVRSNPYDLFLFRNYGDSKFGSIYGSSYAPMWLVGWASCALPTYVRGPSNSNLNSIGYNMITKTQLVDGSLVSSSPSLISLQELTSIYNINLRSLVKDNMDLFLSIGTSKSENENASINSSTWQILMNCKNLMYNTQLQHLHVKNLFDEYENKYHRIQLPIYPGCKHGKTSKEAVDAVLTSTIQFISRHDNQRIEQIVNILNQ
ncbi:patatin-family phospholipase [Theileria orientalis strain Shintoku]|uniref:Patatin-family phospholipase n=1 Tax=Theileria orientalis strain Shintoku TaxID=869250 RepID=J4C2Z2_THEOR|nr:patatin-family phospholipase [Theileria orientalis strain Shintoku]BAM39536.1 patatin-family phospholipase [Theileria orientalis strain Shintoku]|eukprot:XP_009689837.1 patatin-family phospholipase [Theileria orientalis strain Shintoku]